jgi:hypothetical protein
MEEYTYLIKYKVRKRDEYEEDEIVVASDKEGAIEAFLGMHPRGIIQVIYKVGIDGSLECV